MPEFITVCEASVERSPGLTSMSEMDWPRAIEHVRVAFWPAPPWPPVSGVPVWLPGSVWFGTAIIVLALTMMPASE